MEGMVYRLPGASSQKRRLYYAIDLPAKERDSKSNALIDVRISEMKPLTWFRMYSEAVDDEKLRLLAFEDRWHFVAILCCKAKRILDGDNELTRRKIATYAQKLRAVV
jgi:hypothetical protein